MDPEALEFRKKIDFNMSVHMKIVLVDLTLILIIKLYSLFDDFLALIVLTET